MTRSSQPTPYVSSEYATSSSSQPTTRTPRLTTGVVSAYEASRTVSRFSPVSTSSL
ncbi:hypothetical protein [Haladaptatus halobius]|uniref:hypothetical protein n=1 Tax=Haladaptatus halobius TaxID=2884875 RepID=UPI001D0A25EB|nr:hypothetical protein [Haladaptatus halobius]